VQCLWNLAGKRESRPAACPDFVQETIAARSHMITPNLNGFGHRFSPEDVDHSSSRI
jgi:hypothetical protein